MGTTSVPQCFPEGLSHAASSPGVRFDDVAQPQRALRRPGLWPRRVAGDHPMAEESLMNLRDCGALIGGDVPKRLVELSDHRNSVGPRR